MNFKFLLISILITTGLVGGAFAQQIVQLTPQEFTQEEIDKMKNTAVHITTNEGTMLIELYPEDAPNTCLLYTSPSPRDRTRSRMPSSA